MRQKHTGAFAAVTAVTLGVVMLTGCGTEDWDDCRNATPAVMFLGTDHHYHYGSPTGKLVPATQVPKSARTAPGYKAPSAKIAPPPKVDLRKPGNAAPPRPAAPAPRPAGRR